MQTDYKYIRSVLDHAFNLLHLELNLIFFIFNIPNPRLFLFDPAEMQPHRSTKSEIIMGSVEYLVNHVVVCE